MSQPLLESIFDPHSAGHDGAALIQGNRVVRFGCHLPLSMEAGRFPNVGLRHTAALGLAERSDAICIVVSEERGAISIAKGEDLHQVENAAALKMAIESFYEEKTPPETQRKTYMRWLKDNPREKIMAIMLACILWIFFGYQKDSISREFAVPIEYINASRDWVLHDVKTTKAQVVLMGSSQGFRFLKADSLKLSVDLSMLKDERQDFLLTKELLNVPSNLSVASISPGRVEVRASRLKSVSFPIKVTTTNRPVRGLSVQRITVNPPHVDILLPVKKRQQYTEIQTEPIDLHRLSASTVVEPKILYPPEAHFPGDKAPSVKVYIEMKGKAASPDAGHSND
ncbi:MAG: diadenylate cyclase [Deltaproteobacteria bacterium]|nr:diadenylate cyclase [Deltaproteobacteria bacterium]